MLSVPTLRCTTASISKICFRASHEIMALTWRCETDDRSHLSLWWKPARAQCRAKVSHPPPRSPRHMFVHVNAAIEPSSTDRTKASSYFGSNVWERRPKGTCKFIDIISQLLPRGIFKPRNTESPPRFLLLLSENGNVLYCRRARYAVALYFGGAFVQYITTCRLGKIEDRWTKTRHWRGRIANC